MEEKALIAQILRGETQAFRAIVDQNKDLVFSIALSFVKHREEAEELSQDVFLKVYKNLPRFRFQSKLSTWIYRIAYRTAMDAVKKKRLPVMVLDASSEQSAYHVKSSLDELLQAERKQIVKLVMGYLNGQHALVLTLFYLKEFSLEEISEITKIAPANVKMQLHRGRKQFYKVLNQLLNEEAKLI